jgi:YD repeat-containing protein
MGPEGEPYVGWVDRGSSFGPPGAPTESFLFTKRNQGGGWTDPIKVSEERRAPSGDLAVAQAGGEIHWSWHDSELDQIRHRRSGKFDDVKIVSRAEGVSIPRCVVDSRAQVHILYNTSLGTAQGYAARVNRPFDTVDPNPKWGRREPIETGAECDMIELVLNQNDNLYATFSRECLSPLPGNGNGNGNGNGDIELPPIESLSMPPLATLNDDGEIIIEPIPGLQIGRIFYSQTFEPNLGEQDAFGMFGWGPNASANALNGNLFLTLPIFSSRGVGFSTNLSLIHNTLKWDKGVMNPGWMMNYLLILTDHNPTGEEKGTPLDVINLVLGDGRRIVFRFNPAHGRHIAEERYGYFSSIERFAPGTGNLRDGTVVSYKLVTKFSIEYGFDPSGRLARIVDTQPTPNTFVIDYADDESSPPTETGDGGIVPVKLTDSAGRETELDYDNLDRLVAIKDPPDPRFGQRTFTIVYAPGINGLNGGVKEVHLPEGVTWTFDYWLGNNDNPPPDRQSSPESGKERRNLLKKVTTPRGNSFIYRYRQDNRAIEVQEPREKHVTSEGSDGDPEDFVTTAKLSYEWPLESIETPNGRRPDQTAQVGVVFEPDQDEETQGQVTVRGNNVPETRFKNRRGFVTTIEYQYARSLADNIEDALGKHLVRIFNGAFGSRTPEPTFRNLTLFEDKGVNEEETKNETRYVYEGASVPPWVRDNLEEIHRPGVSPPIRYTYKHDGLNRVESVTDSRGHKTTYGYSAAGNLTSIGYPSTTLEDGSTQLAAETFFYDSRGRLELSTSAEGGTTTFQYGDPKTHARQL